MVECQPCRNRRLAFDEQVPQPVQREMVPEVEVAGKEEQGEEGS
jgi:hypothetical protein